MKRARKALKRYFIPHEENDHKPSILRPRTVAFVIVIALVVEGVFIFGSSYLAPRSKLFGIILVNALVDGTNQARASDGLPALQENSLLDAAAQEKANDMVANNYFAHTSPAGLSPWYWFVKVGYDFQDAGENLAVNFADSSDVTDAWLASPDHRANILDTQFTQIGMATAQGTYDGVPAIYVVELFGTPAAAIAPIAAAPVPTPTSKPAIALVPPVIPAASTANATGGGPVAVEGMETQVAAGPTASPTVVPIAVPVTAGSSASVQPQSNFVQTVASAPREAVDYLYFAIVLFFGLALVLNVFIKVRIQHPSLIFGGMLVILIAGMLIVLNQHYLLAGATVI